MCAACFHGVRDPSPRGRHRAVMNVFDQRPSLAPSVFVAPNASIIGNVEVKCQASIWWRACCPSRPPHVQSDGLLLQMRPTVTRSSCRCAADGTVMVLVMAVMNGNLLVKRVRLVMAPSVHLAMATCPARESLVCRGLAQRFCHRELMSNKSQGATPHAMHHLSTRISPHSHLLVQIAEPQWNGGAGMALWFEGTKATSSSVGAPALATAPLCR